MNEYVLTFICKETGKEFKGKKIIVGEYSVLNPETKQTERLKTTELRKRFKSSKGNHCIATKMKFSRPRMYRAKTMTKKFRDYLKGENDFSVKEIA